MNASLGFYAFNLECVAWLFETVEIFCNAEQPRVGIRQEMPVHG